MERGRSGYGSSGRGVDVEEGVDEGEEWMRKV